MAEVAGKDCVIKISGAATAMVGEATTEDVATKVYQITNSVKHVLDRTGTIRVHKKTTSFAAEDGNTTTIYKGSHGMIVGDLICNETRSNAFRLILTKADDSFTVASVTGQAAGDTIMKYPTELTTAYSLNRLNGKVTYASATSRVIKISGDYLPMSTAAYANNAGVNRFADLLNSTKFGTDYVCRTAGLKSASGSLIQIDLTDTTYATALAAGLPIVIEIKTAAANEPDRYWALLEADELAAAIDGLQNEIVTWVSYDAWIRLGL